MREADIRPSDILDEYLRLSAEDAVTFFSDHTALVRRSCPGCGANDAAPAFRKHNFQLVVCRHCESLYVDPAPAAESLDAFYRDSPSSAYWAKVFFPVVAEARRPRIFRPRAQRVLEIAGTLPGMLIDVGAGAGIFLEEFGRLSPGTRLAAVEPGADLAASCRDKGFDTFAGFAEEAADGPLAASADVVTCFEVIEHVHSPARLVSAMAAMARPGGLVIVSGLSGEGFDIRLLGRHSKAVAPPHHLNFLSRAGVAALVPRAGLTPVDYFTPGELDVDIVLNALNANRNFVEDRAMADYLLGTSEAERAALQRRIAAEGRSSHMWFVARRTGGGRPGRVESR